MEESLVMKMVPIRQRLLDSAKELNGIDASIDMEPVEIKDKSILNWYKYPCDTQDVDSIVFRSRYLSVIMWRYANEIHQIAGKLYKMNRSALTTKDTVKEDQLLYQVETVANNIENFRDAFLSGNDFDEEIIPIIDYAFLYQHSHKKERKLELLREQTIPMINTVRDNVYRSVIGKGAVEDNQIVDNIMKIATILATGQPIDKYMRGPFYEDYKDKNLIKDSYQKEVERLGQVIWNIIKFHGHHTLNECGDEVNEGCVLYEAFGMSYPDLTFAFSGVVKNHWLYEGCVALEFAKFVINDSVVSKYIDRVLGKK